MPQRKLPRSRDRVTGAAAGFGDRVAKPAHEARKVPERGICDRAAFPQNGDSGIDGGPLLVNHFDAQAGTWGMAEVLDPETGTTLSLVTGPSGSSRR
jgi:hypothetical protein